MGKVGGAGDYVIHSEKFENHKNSTHSKIKLYIIFIIFFSTTDIKFFTYRGGGEGRQAWGIIHSEK